MASEGIETPLGYSAGAELSWIPGADLFNAVVILKYNGGVAKLVDALALEVSGEIREGSNPSSPTKMVRIPPTVPNFWE